MDLSEYLGQSLPDVFRARTITGRIHGKINVRVAFFLSRLLKGTLVIHGLL